MDGWRDGMERILEEVIDIMNELQRDEWMDGWMMKMNKNKINKVDQQQIDGRID